MGSITTNKSYKEFETYCLDKGYSLSQLSSKKSYFKKDEVKYAELLDWIDTYREKHTIKQKISPEKARSYLKKYGATVAVEVLLSEGVSITRQGLYKSAKEVKDDE